MMAGVSLLTGLVVGIVFCVLRLPVPAPMVFEGVLGVVGLWLGYRLATLAIQYWPAVLQGLGIG